MDVEDTLPVEFPTNDTNLPRLLYLFVLVATVLGAAHHVDHSFHRNHVGWPLRPHGNPFTIASPATRCLRSVSTRR